MEKLTHLLENNRRWSERVRQNEPTFFTELAEQQTPEYLWVGCSDSRVSANTIVGLNPGEIFVHRNIANLVIHTDMNCLSVLQFAIDVLRVKHIIITGHYGCGGVQAALEEKRHGLIDNWLRHIQDTANLYADSLAAIVDNSARLDRLCELNVVEQVINTSETTAVQDAWGRGQELAIHGWIYGLKDGIVRDLDIQLENRSDMRLLRSRFLANGQPSSAAVK
ncbi:MAG: carbonate dehydratase [Acidobacteriota bacterium]